MTNEELKQAAEVMLAAAEGKQIQVAGKESNLWVDCIYSPAWDWAENTYRIKPAKALRPWKPEEVPLGAQTRPKNNNVSRLSIVGVHSGGVLLGQDNGAYPFDSMLKRREHSIDGGITWKPCGVEVES